MLTDTEMKILVCLKESNLLTKQELIRKVNSGSDKSLDVATKGLVEKELITCISPIGSTCFIITQKGAKYLDEED